MRLIILLRLQRAYYYIHFVWLKIQDSWLVLFDSEVEPKG